MRKLGQREPKDESGVTAEAIDAALLRGTEELLRGLEQRILRVKDHDLKDKCFSLGLQLSLALGLDEQATRKAARAS